MRFRRQIFALRPWQADFGDPDNPVTLLGVPVQRRLLRSSDRSEALVVLADRRFALTGRTVAIGPASQLAQHLRHRAAQTTSSAERSWLRAAATKLDHPADRDDETSTVTTGQR